MTGEYPRFEWTARQVYLGFQRLQIDTIAQRKNQRRILAINSK